MSGRREDYIYIPLKVGLGTRELIDACAALMGKDEQGNVYRGYYVVHMALTGYKRYLERQKEGGKR